MTYVTLGGSVMQQVHYAELLFGTLNLELAVNDVVIIPVNSTLLHFMWFYVTSHAVI